MRPVLVALIVFFSLKAEHFFSWANFQTIVNQAPPAIFLALGMTFVLLAGGIDLSVGSVMALSAAALGLSVGKAEWPVWAGAIAAIATGLTCGAVNGLIVARWRMPSFIVTLGMLEIARGAAYKITNSQTKYIGSDLEGLIQPLPVIGLPVSFLLAVAVVIARGASSAAVAAFDITPVSSDAVRKNRLNTMVSPQPSESLSSQSTAWAAAPVDSIAMPMGISPPSSTITVQSISS